MEKSKDNKNGKNNKNESAENKNKSPGMTNNKADSKQKDGAAQNHFQNPQHAR